MKTLMIGQKFTLEFPARVKNPTLGEMRDIPAGVSGYVAGNGYIILTESPYKDIWVPIDRKFYTVAGIDYEGIANIVADGLISGGYNLDAMARIYIADYLRSIALN